MKQTFPQEKSRKVDFLDISIFKNVKSDYKMKFHLQNEKEYKIKMLSLQSLLPYRKP